MVQKCFFSRLLTLLQEKYGMGGGTKTGAAAGKKREKGEEEGGNVSTGVETYGKSYRQTKMGFP